MFSKEFDVLDKIIKEGSYEERFAVFPPEASSGKTQRIIRSVAEAPSHLQFLIVTKFIDEVIRIVNGINKIKGKPVAKGLISEVDKLDKGNLFLSDREFDMFDQIIVITHATYTNICKGNKPYLEGIVGNFDTLIIDEELNPVKHSIVSYKYSDYIKVYSNIKSFSKNMAEEFNIICQYLNDEIKNKEKYTIGNQYLFAEKYNESSETICTLIDFFIVNIRSNEVNFNTKMDDEKIDFTAYKLIEMMELIKEIYISLIDGQALIHAGYKEIVTYDYNFKYFMLKNNIMLDASAKFAELYKSNLFKVFETERKIDHSKCNVVIINEKTTSSAKNKKLVEFRKMLANYVINTLGTDGKGLIATKKAEAEYLDKNEFNEFDNEIKEEIEKYNANILNEPIDYTERLSTCNYENQRGRNDYADFNHVFLAHTYRMPAPYYIFLHRFYFPEIELTNDDIIADKIRKKDAKYGEWGFKNNERLQKLMFTDMVSSQYQTLKRIARNQSPKATYHFFTTDVFIIKAVLDELYGFNFENITVIKEFCNDKKITKKDELMMYIEETISNTGKWTRIKSEDLKKKLNINRNKWLEIWKDEEFLTFCKEKRIKEANVKGQKGKWVIKY